MLSRRRSPGSASLRPGYSTGQTLFRAEEKLLFHRIVLDGVHDHSAGPRPFCSCSRGARVLAIRLHLDRMARLNPCTLIVNCRLTTSSLKTLPGASTDSIQTIIY